MRKELTSQEVKFNFKFKESDLKGSVTKIPEIDSEYEKIGRALNINKEGYNLYLIDSFSKEKLKKLQGYIEEQYKYLEPPKDICYVSLEDDKKPEVLFVSNGNGKKLKDAVEEIRNNYIEIVEEFYNASSEDEKDELIEEIQSKRNDYISELMEMAKKEDFEVKVTNKGFAFIPLISGKVISEREYDNLEKNKKEAIVAKASILKKKAEAVLGKLKEIETKSIKKLKEIYSDFLANEMEGYKDEVLLEFIDDDAAYEYLEKLFISMEKEIISCYTMDIEEDEEQLYQVINKYDIHLLVDNSLRSTPPVIYEEDPNLNNLMGFIEYENHNGVYTTDISLINSGTLLKANGGCLIVRVSSLANNSYSYYHLKKALITNKITYDISKSYVEVISISGLKPQPIPIDVKVILIGDQETYDTLYSLDEDFRKLFPLRAEFNPIVETNDNVTAYINKSIKDKVKRNNLMPITEDGVNEIIKYLSRTANSKTKINIDTTEIEKLMILANDNAKKRNSLMIESKDIVDIAYVKERIENEYDKLYKENKILISIIGKKVGVINALAVLDTGYHSFGKPMRITCVSHKGSGRIVDIHKESRLSGKIHEKSINILKGLLNNIINPYEEIPVDFYLSFEQIYGLVDGDSASVAEIICILSSLSKRPIKQTIAVTGSINQLGEVQAIGGVNEKIEGFYRVCDFLDTVKNKGVLIPSSNKDELILIPEIEKSIENGDFHIYTMDNLDDAIETLILEEGESLEDFYTSLQSELKKYKKVIEKKEE
ncbi:MULTISPECIES: AAA family ATPase [Clostridium]|jgi:lon-related putative ATP-dependent protease|uniref:AAA family ATPase n=1 Tax=Clostridium TaxID=1485 RepID=UPI0011599E3F|nr:MULTISPECIES: AAA family ATPase [Clostridium]MBS5305836.1 AAA family ATPase [Clostridium sp.]MDB1944317.1 AAA family ATPase [Clostridium tertium]MDB1950621.1 AAA family ATPase [Clostridium tertium]MDB1970236.1 AAA family ATPase [Clostridium tertium]MDU1277947.1 AAA family ATPase [Clostridium sp.]